MLPDWGFSTRTITVTTDDGRNVIVVTPFTYTTKAGETIAVPAGARSDGASTPRILWRVLPPFGSYWLAAVLHDHLYRDTAYPKDFCDSTLLEAMEWLGVPLLEREAIHEGVVVGGNPAFYDDRVRPKLHALLVARGTPLPPPS